jgi:hypothetical protein
VLPRLASALWLVAAAVVLARLRSAGDEAPR